MNNALYISIEIEGKSTLAGIIEKDADNAPVFRYAPEYLASETARPISVGFPLQTEAFSPNRTLSFFGGLLPEGFTRRAIANRLHVDETDYASILSALGCECIGAVRISDSPSDKTSKSYEELSAGQLNALAREGTVKSTEILAKTRLSLAGASGKVGLYYNDGKWFLPYGTAPSTHIVKQSHVRLESIVLNECLSMTAARLIGIVSPECFVVNPASQADDKILFAIKRYDRIICEDAPLVNGLPCPFRLHQEDFAQALGVQAPLKYEPDGCQYLCDMFSLLKRFSANPIEDYMKLWRVTIFNFLIGNADNHLKNHALLYDKALKSIRLAPAYDILSTAIYDTCTRKASFRIGKKQFIDEIGRADFEQAAQICGIGKTVAMREFDSLANTFEKSLNQAAGILFDQGVRCIWAIYERIMKNGGFSHLH